MQRYANKIMTVQKTSELATALAGLSLKLKVYVNLIRHLQCFHCYQNEIHHLLLRGVTAGGLLVRVGPNVHLEVLRVLEVVLSLAVCPNRMTLDDVVQRRPL